MTTMQQTDGTLHTAVRPAAQILQRPRLVPVVDAKPRLEVRGNQTIDEPIVEGKPRFVDRPFAQVEPPFRGRLVTLSQTCSGSDALVGVMGSGPAKDAARPAVRCLPFPDPLPSIVRSI